VEKLETLDGKVKELMDGVEASARDRLFKLPWREADPPNHHDDKVDSDQ